MKIERIYYRLWSKEAQRDYQDRARTGMPTALELCAINIECNNALFVEELETIIPKGFGYCNNWLKGLIADYVKRCSRDNGDTPYLLEYYIDWLNNTMLILNGKYPFIDEWCKEYREWIIDYFQKESTPISCQPQEELYLKEKATTVKKSQFSDLIQYENKEALLERLHFLIDGKGGVDAAAIIVRATDIDKYLLRYPKQKEYESEFTLIGSWEAIRKNLCEPDNNMMDRLKNVIIFS